jgi:hypothetical protein
MTAVKGVQDGLTVNVNVLTRRANVTPQVLRFEFYSSVTSQTCQATIDNRFHPVT